MTPSSTTFEFPTPEHARLFYEDLRTPGNNWKRWGPYLSERQWGTVREDYSDNSEPWDHFTHDQSRSRTYRWGEDGLLGICDRQCRLCFSPVLWNGNDSILKERLFGLTGPEGNHGEDVKELYYYLDSTPTHSYMKAMYKYPQDAYPYEALVDQNRILGRDRLEFELLDTGLFKDNRYFDVEVEYAKGSPNDILIQLTVTNCGPKTASLYVLPTFWYRNIWSWGRTHEAGVGKPSLKYEKNSGVVRSVHPTLQEYVIQGEVGPDGKTPQWLFTENETRPSELPASKIHYSKDAFHRYLIEDETKAINPQQTGTKTAACYQLTLAAGESQVIRLRMTDKEELKAGKPFGDDFHAVMENARSEADQFYNHVIPADSSEDERQITRQAYAGLLWTKQFYHMSVRNWLEGDPIGPIPPESRKHGRNSDWPHLFNRDIISMPDKWEYPWYAAWDSAFHMLTFSEIDPEFAKDQLLLFLREWYMHPNGQIPAYEWNFSDVNPPVHAWSCWRVYQRSGQRGSRDRDFLKRVFNKLLLNFTWWVNRKDVRGEHVFSGGFLGLDNIGVFDRSKPLPTGGSLEQADGTAWMAFFCSSMMTISLELAEEHQSYGDMASKFFEHYVAIAEAMNTIDGTGLWDEEDGFYYDHLKVDGKSIPLKIRSVVGLIPLITVDVLFDKQVNQLTGFKKRTDWFLKNRKDITQKMTYLERPSSEEEGDGIRLLSIPSTERLKRILAYMLDEEEFLSPYGIRSLSKVHEEKPFVFDAGGDKHIVSYVPGESDSWMFGGNSNWRGPVWFPVNFLLIEALERYHQFYGDQFQVECPTGSGNFMNLKEVAREIERRLIHLFSKDSQGKRPCHGEAKEYVDNPDWQDLILFYEYFHGDNGRGLGASHQTGWTALVASLIRKLYKP